MAPHADFSPVSEMTYPKKKQATRRRFSANNLSSALELAKICQQKSHVEDYPFSSTISKNIPIYDLSTIPKNVSMTDLQDEWHHALLNGPGVLVLQNMYTDTSVLERTNQAFNKIIERERKSSAKGDHFAAGGKNDRIWNSFSKHCIEDPTSFVEYYSNPWLARICEAWLGGQYRITAQTNIVKPGGAAQICHRDYHLGFQTAEACASIPAATQIATQFLTLQGAVAHTDMPLVSGPTRFLPFSQQLPQGYLAYRSPEINQYFLDHYVSLPLKLGDGVFFNPALMHAAGCNETTDFARSANLLQVSSAFGKPMEMVDSIPLIEACWDQVVKKYEREEFSDELRALVDALGEGYPFPTNLDRRPPAPNGMAPESEQEFLRRALCENMDTETTLKELKQMREDSLPG